MDSLSSQLRLQGLQISRLETQGGHVAFEPVTSEGYQVLQSRLGPLAVSIEDVRAFASGTRVVLQVGNASSVTFDGAEFSVTYGPPAPTDLDEEGWEDYQAWFEGLLEAELTTASTLSPGVWNEVQLDLPGIEPSALGFLELEISTDRIRLQRPP